MKTSITIAWFNVAWSLSACSGVSFAQERRHSVDFRANADMVLVPVTVMSRRGEILSGLQRDNFTLLEDQVTQPIVSFTGEDVPCSVRVILDLSGSMREALGPAKAAARAFLETSNPDDDFFLLTVSDSPRMASGFTCRTNEVERNRRRDDHWIAGRVRSGKQALFLRRGKRSQRIRTERNYLSFLGGRAGVPNRRFGHTTNGSTVLSSTVNSWQQRTCESDEHCLTSVADTTLAHGAMNSAVDPRIAASQQILTNAGTASETFLYDRYNNKTQVSETDYGGTVLRTTNIQYLSTNPVNNIGYTAAPVFLRHLPTQVSVLDSTSPLSQTTFEYDNYGNDARHAPLVGRAAITQLDSTVGNGRGNATMITRSNSSGPTPVTSKQYDVAGNVVVTQDANGNPTATDYAANGNSYAFPTTITDALGFVTLTAWDTSTGTPTSISTQLTRVPTYAVTTFSYSDPLDRITAIVRPDGGSTTYSYNDNANTFTMTVTVAADPHCLSGSSVVNDRIYDGLGRTTREVRHDPAGLVFVDTAYDGGRVSRASHPYFSGATPQFTSTSYDSLGRIQQIKAPDGSPVSNTYTGNQTVTKDPQGNTRTTTQDALGRLAYVTEANGVRTRYVYDGLDSLISVSQNVDNSGNCAGCVTRSFQYDSLKRLRQAIHPESGTATYTYDTKGNVKTRRAPLENVNNAQTLITTYTYEQLNRVLAKTYSDGTPQVSYAYDDPGVANSLHHLTSITATDSTSTPAKIYKTSFTSFDVMENVTASTQLTSGQQPYSFVYAYNQASSLEFIQYPSQRQVTTCYDAAERPNVETGLLNGTTTPYVKSVTYAAHGGVTALLLGNKTGDQLNEQTTYSPERLQPTQITAGSLLSLNYDYCYPNPAPCAKNNGSLRRQTIGRGSSSWTQTYGYDLLDRLTTANEAGPGTAWSETYGYDSYGNRWVANTTATALTAETPIAGSWYNANNQIVGWSYDGAGNVLSVASTQRSFTYDAENRQVTANINGLISTYIYDGEGHRVQRISPGGTTTYVYDAQGQLAAEYGPATDAGTSYPTPDALGSNRLLTYAPGFAAIPRCYDYLPFGQEIASGTDGRPVGTPNQPSCWGAGSYPSNPPDVTSEKFTAKERDAETGLDFFQARYMSAAQGRFSSPDPSNLSVDFWLPQTWNRYAYVGNNPLAYVDRNGLWWTKTHGEIIDDSFPGLSSSQRQILKDASYATDYKNKVLGFDPQDPQVAFVHSMSDGTDPDEFHRIGLASQLADWFIRTNEAAASQAQADWIASGHTGISPNALTAFGNALHAVADATSPTHEGYQPWSGCVKWLPGCPNAWVHGFL
jgi:RHS repeat-associated protein